MFKNLLCSVHNAGYSIKTGSFKPMIHGPICRIRHVGYDKIWGCLIVYHPLKHHATPSDNVVRKIGRVQFSSDSNQLCRMDKPIKWQVFVHVVMFMVCVYVHVLI